MKRTITVILALLMTITAIPTVMGQTDNLVISQEDTVSYILPNGDASYLFEVYNPGTESATTFVVVEEPPEGYILDYQTSQITVPALSTVAVYINLTAGSGVQYGQEFPLNVEFSNTRAGSFTVTLIVDEIIDTQIYSLPARFTGVVALGSWTEYDVVLYNEGNSDDTVQVAFSDFSIDYNRAFNVTFGWSMLAHGTSGVHSINDEIDYVQIPATGFSTFYVDVEPAADAVVGDTLTFNVTMTSLSTSSVLTQTITTTVVEDDYDVNLLLLSESNETSISPNTTVDFDFRVYGSALVNETVRLNVIGNQFYADLGWKFLIKNANGSVLGGFYRDVITIEGFPILDHEDAIANPGAVSVVSGPVTGDTYDSATNGLVSDSYGVYDAKIDTTIVKYTGTIYEHPYDVSVEAGEYEDLTLSIEIPGANLGISQQRIPVVVTASCVQAMNRSVISEVSGETDRQFNLEFAGDIQIDQTTLLYIVAAFAAVVVVLIVAYIIAARKEVIVADMSTRDCKKVGGQMQNDGCHVPK